MKAPTNKAIECAPILTITGRVRAPFKITMKELHSMNHETLNDLPLICGSGTPKGTIKEIKGVLLEDIIRKADVMKEEENTTKKCSLSSLPMMDIKPSFRGRKSSTR